MTKAIKYADDNSLDIFEGNDKRSKRHFFKQKLIPHYIFWRNLLKNMNYVFYLLWLLVTKDRYQKLFKKVNHLFENYNYKHDLK